MNRLSLTERAQILACLCEGNSIRSTARLTGAAINTVVKLLIDAGHAWSYKLGKFKTLSLENINYYVDTFLLEARILPFKTYLVTKLGCGHAGYTPEDIAPLFKGHPSNVVLPKEFHDIINKNKL